MVPLKAEITIGRPREEVFDYLADVANHPEFTDHYLEEWHLTRVDSYGQGAGARFRIAMPGNRFGWTDVTLAEVSAPWRIVERGRTGKFNRNRLVASYTLSPVGPQATRVEYELETEPALPTDRLMESLPGVRLWLRRQVRRSLLRLRSILEEGLERGARVTVAGGEERYPAARGGIRADRPVAVTTVREPAGDPAGDAARTGSE